MHRRTCWTDANLIISEESVGGSTLSFIYIFNKFMLINRWVSKLIVLTGENGKQTNKNVIVQTLLLSINYNEADIV